MNRYYSWVKIKDLLLRRKGPDMKPMAHRQKEMRNILAALFFLSKEARGLGLVELSQIIRQAMKRAEDWASGHGTNVQTLVVNEETYLVLEFLNEFVQAGTKSRQEFLDTVKKIKDFKTRRMMH